MKVFTKFLFIDFTDNVKEIKKNKYIAKKLKIEIKKQFKNTGQL